MLAPSMCLRILIALVLGLVAAETRAASQPTAPRPNLVFLLTDDMRWDALGCAGDKIIHTPNVDRLAAQGVLFHNCFATTPICAVSRASIFTGQYERRHGVADFSTPLTADQWAQTYPALLRQAGYRVGFIGKFGVGSAPEVKAKADAFDYWRGRPGQAGGYFIDPKDPTHTHTTAKFGNQALEFLDGCAPGKPFCLALSFNAPHARDGKPREFQPDLRDESLYADVTLPVPLTATEEYFKKLPEFVQKSEARKRWEARFATPQMFQSTMRDYYRLISGIDREVGRIVQKLTERGVATNTVIIFTSDNGWFAGERGLADKWFMYEESIRLPLVVYDPRLPAARRGQTVDAMALNIDFAPTLLELAGVTAPPVMQGRSLIPLLLGHAPSDWRTEFFDEHHTFPKIIPPSEGVRTERWSYFRWLSPNPELEELYDVKADPHETRNLVIDTNCTSVLKSLRDKRDRYATELK
jgi:arylsulfatase A-like enzyme